MNAHGGNSIVPLHHDPAFPRALPSAELSSPWEVYMLSPSEELPVVDLSRTLGQTFLSVSAYRSCLLFMRNHFHHLVWGFRCGIVCFAALFFVHDGSIRILLSAIMIPATLSLFATGLFLSVDVMRLLTHSYEFWFTTTMNTINWIAFAVLLGDSRACMSYLGWFAFQIVIVIDASYRTYPTAVNSMIVGIPVILTLCALVSLRLIDGGNFFTFTIRGHAAGDAADLIGLTGSTLSLFLAKMVVLKKRRVGPATNGAGQLNLPCVLIKTKLRLVPVTSTVTSVLQKRSSHLSIATQPDIKTPTAIQRVRLSLLPIAQIDARHTLLPYRFWRTASSSLSRLRRAIRLIMLTIMTASYALLVLQTIRVIRVQMATFSSLPFNEAECHVTSTNSSDRARSIVAFIGTLCFVSVSALFYQRDLLRLLLTNFDYGFSIFQVACFGVCLGEMLCWELSRCLTISSWVLLFIWALSIDAFSPLVKQSWSARLHKRLAALLVATIIAIGLGSLYVALFVPANGLRDRVVLHVSLSTSHSLAVRTRSLLLGRMATVSLWCSRHVVVLLRRTPDELHLIRGLLEFDSPFATFPRRHCAHAPAIED